MEILTEIHSTSAPLDGYERFSPGIGERLREYAAPVQRIKILHINSSSQGGGVAELLQSQVPLERALGLDSRWYVMSAQQDFFWVTKKMHNLLQGAPSASLSDEEKRLYEDTGRAVGKGLEELFRTFPADIVFIHDYQPLFAIDSIRSRSVPLLRIHGDLSRPHSETLDFLRDKIMSYRGVVFSHAAFVPSWLEGRNGVRIILPAIDPFTEKNRPIENAEELARSIGIDLKKPCITQISRFDPWKDPIGVIEAYFLARKIIPDLQLVLAGSHASDDPEGETMYREARRFAGADPGIIFYAEQNDVMVNAIRTVSAVIIQKSIREGFGLTVTEAMWKEKAVVGGNAAGIRAQITDGKNGFLVSSPADAARVVVTLMGDPALRATIGKNARRTVIERFLMTRYIEEHLAFYADMTG